MPGIIEDVGEENVLTFQTDLTTLDGLKVYGVMESKIGLPTLEFYRANVEIFDEHKVEDWIWLATPESAKPHDDPYWALCVTPAGTVIPGNARLNSKYGARPLVYLNSALFDE